MARARQPANSPDVRLQQRLGAVERRTSGGTGGKGRTGPIQNSAEPLRIVRGSVDTTSGGLLTGAGFTSARLGVGSVRITFSPAFSAAPDIGATPGGAPSEIRYSNKIAASVDLAIFTSGGAAAEGTISFVVMGPP